MFEPAFVAQVLLSGTNIVVVFGIVDEDGSGETSPAGVVFLRATFAQTPDLVDPKLGHRRDAAAVGEISVG